MHTVREGYFRDKDFFEVIEEFIDDKDNSLTEQDLIDLFEHKNGKIDCLTYSVTNISNNDILAFKKYIKTELKSQTKFVIHIDVFEDTTEEQVENILTTIKDVTSHDIEIKYDTRTIESEFLVFTILY